MKKNKLFFLVLSLFMVLSLKPNQDEASQIKAPRPNSNNVVGPLIGCDCAEIQRLLEQLNLQIVSTGTTNITINSVCQATPITASTTIVVPGYYCLAQDITGFININSSNVVLDLNNHTITFDGANIPINIIAGTEIMVQNGTIIDVSGLAIGGSTDLERIIINKINIADSDIGISFTAISSFMFNNITVDDTNQAMVFEGTISNGIIQNSITRNSNGIPFDCSLASMENITISNYTLFNSGDTAMFFGSAFNMHFSDIIIDSVDGSGLLFNDFSQTCYFNRISVNSLSGNGFGFENFLFNGYFNDCHVANNGSSSGEVNGFSIFNSFNNEFINCSAKQIVTGIEIATPSENDAIVRGPGDARGFFIGEGTSLKMTNCVAQGIGSGNVNGYGFLISNNNNFVLKDCTTESIFSGLPVQTGAFCVLTCTGFTLEDCQAIAVFSTRGFYVDSQSTTGALNNCVAQNCDQEGFLIEGTESSLAYCEAIACSNGFDFTGTNINCDYSISRSNLSNGFITSGTQVVLGNCSALQNVVSGFDGGHLYHCFAQFNGTDYTSIIGPTNNVFDTTFAAGANLFF